MRLATMSSVVFLTACGPSLGGPRLISRETSVQVTQGPPVQVSQPPVRVVVNQAPTEPQGPLQVATGSGPVRLVCPTGMSAPAGSPVHLVVQSIGDAQHVRWSVSHGPREHAWRFAEVYRDSDTDSVVAEGAAVPFTSVIVGDYTLRAEARDADGNVVSCETAVAMRPHGLRVELSWNTQNTDVDMHMLAGPGEGWFSNRDCYFGNRRPDASLGAEPVQRWLDTDDTDGEGPENIRIDEPTPGVDYALGVHYYSSHGSHDPTTAIAVIYCGGERVTRMERSLRGDTPGGSTTNDFWTLGAVRFTPDGRCVLRTLNTVAGNDTVRNTNPLGNAPALMVAGP